MGAEGKRDALEERLFGAVLGMIDVYAVYVGDRLGMYRALAEGAETAAEVAAATQTSERYVREWLEQQAVSGLLEAEDGRFRLPDGHAEVLVQNDSVHCVAPFARMMVGIVRPLPEVLEAFRNGSGVPYERFDEDFCDGQGDMNGAVFDALLGSEWLTAIPDLDERLRSSPPAQVADVACGTGRSTLAIARAYPEVRVDGIDLDEHSIDVANEHLEAAEPDVASRVSFAVRDAADPGLQGRYDLVTVFEAVHDLSNPVEVLGAVRGLLAEGGTGLIMDERVADEFTAPGDEVERVMYGFSILHCLPVGMADQPSAATGTVMRASTLESYAREAGFADVEVLGVEHDFWRFYRLTP
jgi:2-polyprenyl-3-methyl-5-hydroxy-6-metoxy-1,4-benzoquinol methylase